MPCCKINPDSLLSYKSVRTVRIHDYRLGLTYYLAILGIICYVAVYQLWYENRALLAVVPQGTIRMQLQAPVVDKCSSPAYHNSCHNDFTPLKDLPYCAQSNKSSFSEDEQWKFPRFNCTYRDGPGMSGPVQNGAIYAATRISTFVQTNVCGSELAAGKTNCDKIWRTNRNETEFIADVPRFTLLIDPNAEVNGIIEGNAFQQFAPAAVTDSRIYSGVPEASWWGKFWDPRAPSNKYADDLCKDQDRHGKAYSTSLGFRKTSTAPCYIETNKTGGGLDVIELDVLLRASGLSLAKGALNGHSTLYMGAIIVVEMEYTDHAPWAISLPRPMITYKMTWLEKSKFKEDSVVWYNSDRTQRVLEDRHGLWLVGIMTGSFYEFFAMNFFVQCTTFVSFISIATFIVDAIMQYILPQRLFYKARKIKIVERPSKEETKLSVNGNGIECIDSKEKLLLGQEKA